MPIRVDCTTPGLEHCFIEVSERWTRADIQALFEPGKAAELFRRKVTACHLAGVDGAAITNAPGTYDEAGELAADLDVRLVRFVPAALVLAVDEIASLGKANARLSSGGTERATTTMPPATMTETPAA
jgi:hypothetical protein